MDTCKVNLKTWECTLFSPGSEKYPLDGRYQDILFPKKTKARKWWTVPWGNMWNNTHWWVIFDACIKKTNLFIYRIILYEMNILISMLFVLFFLRYHTVMMLDISITWIILKIVFLLSNWLLKTGKLIREERWGNRET